MKIVGHMHGGGCGFESRPVRLRLAVARLRRDTIRRRRAKAGFLNNYALCLQFLFALLGIGYFSYNRLMIPGYPSYSPDSLSRFLYISDGVVWAVFLIVLLIFLVFTWILTYHWRNYDLGRTLMTLRAKIVYFMGSSVIILIMTLSLIAWLNK